MSLLAGLLLTPLYYLTFALSLLVFHPIQVITINFGGYELHKKSVGILNSILVRSLFLVGAKMHFEGFEKLPHDRPLIVVSNHQSFFDIQAFVHGFNNWHPKFVSKIELGRGLPSISYNLRHGGSALIDRDNGRQAVTEIIKLGKLIEVNKYAVCIYPEGTRSHDGQVKPFQSAGVKTLLKAAPSSLVVPFVIDGHDKLMKRGYFPLEFGVKLNYKVLDPIEPGTSTGEEIVKQCEMLIKRELGQI